MKKASLGKLCLAFEDNRNGERASEAEHEEQINELHAEIGRLSAQMSWLKKSGFKLEQYRATGNVGERQSRDTTENTGITTENQ